MIRVESVAYGHDGLVRLTKAVAALKAGGPLTPVIILVPNNTAGLVARRHLARGLGDGSTGVAGIEITTLPRLAEQVAASTLAPRRPATRTVTAAAWRQALSLAPGIFREVADHPATIRALSSTHKELRDLSPDSLDVLSGASALSNEVVSLHRRVTQDLQADWYDETALLGAAARMVMERGKANRIVLYLPQALTIGQARFARALADGGEMTVIAGLTGAKRADEAVHRSLKRMDVTVEDRPTIATADRIINASDSDDEVRCVVREVVAELTSRPGHRVAVLYGARTPYARLLAEQFASAGVTVNGPGVRTVDERAVARAFVELLALADSDVPRADLFRALANAPVRDFVGNRIPLAQWERISRSAGVVRGEDWDTRLSAFIDGQLASAEAEEVQGERPWLAERFREQAAAASDLLTFSTGIRRTLADAAAMKSWSELANWASTLFSALIGEAEDLRRLPDSEQYAAVTIRSTLHGVRALDSVNGQASLAALRDIISLELESALPRVGKFGEGVLVAPVTAAVGLDLDAIYLVGLSEDTYPGRLREDALLPEAVRALVPDELPSYRESLHARYRSLLAAMSSAPVVVATFPRGDLRRSSQRLPSRWLLPSLRELSSDKTLPATEWDRASYQGSLTTSGSFAGELLSTTNLATEQEWRTRAASAGVLTDDVVSSAQDMAAARSSGDFTRFDGNLSTSSGLPNYAVDDRSVSPTALESYASCPHAFFVKRLLGVDPIEQPEDSVAISAADIGNLVHNSFDDLVKEFEGRLPGPGKPWTQDHRTRLMEIADARGREFEARGLTGHPTLWDRERLRVVTDLINMLDVDDAWRAMTGSEVIASELSFGQHGVDPIEIIVPSGRVLMRGSADKVDVASDGTIYVTDIKTGSRRTFKDITEDEPVVGGTKLQLPVYAYAARQRFGDRATPVVTAYWFVRRDPGRVEITLTPEVEERYTQTLDTLVRSISSGMFPAKAPPEADFAWVQCPYCNPDGIGHGEARDRWEHKRSAPVLHDLVSLIDPPSATPEDEAR